MVTLHPEYVINSQQHTKSVLLPFDEWQQLLEELEELDDIRAYDEAKAQPGESIPFEQAVREIRNGEA